MIEIIILVLHVSCRINKFFYILNASEFTNNFWNSKSKQKEGYVCYKLFTTQNIVKSSNKLTINIQDLTSVLYKHNTGMTVSYKLCYILHSNNANLLKF